MANFTGQEFKVFQPTSNINLGLVNQVLAMKQTTYDSNKNQIQSTIDSFNDLDLLRFEDKEYLAAKLTDVTNQIKNYGQRDLSQSFISDDILSKVKSVAADPKILNSLENTAKFRKFQSDVQKVREKNPELYSDVNYNYALNQAKFTEYMNGDVQKLGNLSYTNYVDVNAQALEKIEQLKKLKGERIIEEQDPQNPGRIIKRSINGLTDEEIFEKLPNLLSREEQAQLQINGWYNYGTNLPLAQKNLNSYSSSLKDNIDENIRLNQSLLNNSAVSEDIKKEAQLKIAAYQRQKENLDKQLSQIDVNDAASIGGFLENTTFKYGIADSAKAEWRKEYETDDYFFAKQRMEQSIRAEERANIELNLKLQKELGVDTQGNPITDPNAVTVSAIEGDIAQEINPFTDQMNEYKAVSTEMISTINSAVNSPRTSADIKDSYVKLLAEKGYNPDGSVIKGKETTARSYPVEVAMKRSFDEAGMGTVHGETAKVLSVLESKNDALAYEVETDRVQGLVQVFSKEPEKYISDLRKNLQEASVDMQSDIQEDTAAEIQQIYDKARKFVNRNGGWDNLQKTLENDPNKLTEFADIYDEVYNRPATVTGYASRFLKALINPVYGGQKSSRRNLKEDGIEASNQIARQKTQQRQNASFNTLNVATIGDEKLRERVVNMLPQTADTSLFDPKNPISFYKTPEGDIRIVQNKGYTNAKSQIMLRDAEVIVSSKDAAFNELQRYVDLSDRQRGLDAERTSLEVKPTIPISFIDNSKKTILSKADANLSNIPVNIQRGFTAAPTRLLTETRTKDVYNALLKDKLSEEKINSVVTGLSQNFSKFNVKLKPFDGTWALSVSTKDGKVISEGDTGMKYLEDDLNYLTKYYPNILVADGVLRYLIENPTEVDNLINIMQQP